MAWEDRNGRRYYYRKRRQSGRVVSVYVGKGELAELIAQAGVLLRVEQMQARAEQLKAHAEFTAVSRQVDQVGDQVRTLTRAALLSSGYHMHKGQWRKRRE